MKSYHAVLIGMALLLGSSSCTVAAAESEGLEPSGVNVRDLSSLQRGAKLFVNYCMGCHSANFMRYSRLAEDLDLDKKTVMKNLVFSNAKFFDTMEIAMAPEQAKVWFGKVPPDLSVIGRSRGADWLFAYLQGFYQDPEGGWNNAVLPNAAMPNVLWKLQGIQRPVYRQETGAGGFSHQVIDHFELTSPGTLSPQAYEETARDLSAFLLYLSEPAQLQRKNIGVWVILFLVLFAFVAYLLKLEYWRDVH